MPSLTRFTIAVLLASSQALALPAEDLDKRNQCNEDNVLRAMQHRTPDSWAFCSSYISQPAATTVTLYDTTTVTSTARITATIHPLSLYNMQAYKSTQTPLTYASPASPSTISGGGCNYPPSPYSAHCYPANNKRDLEARQTATPTTSGSVPSYLATVPASRISSGCSCLNVPYATTVTASATKAVTSTASCTTYSALPSAAYPGFCSPRLQINSPSIQPATGNITVAKPVSARSKLDCCKACSDIFNCVWWKFDFAKPKSDGSGDPWASGTCTYAFNTANDQKEYNAAAVCPNGSFNFFKGLSPTDSADANNLPGYNPGPCGGAYNILQSSQDGGYPDNYYQSQCR